MGNDLHRSCVERDRDYEVKIKTPFSEKEIILRTASE